MKVRLTDVRLAFPALDEPRSFTANDGSTSAPKFSAALIIEPKSDAHKAMHAAEVAVAKEKWGEKAGGIYKQLKAGNKLALRDGDSKSSYEGFEGNLFVQASNNVRPMVVDGAKAPLPPGSPVLYSGCRVNAVIDVWPQDNAWGKRINAKLLGIQFLRDDTRFSSAATASEDDFEPVAGATAEASAMFDDDPPKGGDEFDDDIPF